MQNEKFLIAPILFLYYEESACSFLLKSEHFSYGRTLLCQTYYICPKTMTIRFVSKASIREVLVERFQVAMAKVLQFSYPRTMDSRWLNS